jgi:eukaryotic-like serine/threonine-protein kinase
MAMIGTESLSSALADRYRIERELGAGGMATVYLAHDLRHDRRVALKVLRPELAAVIGGERFLSEIKTTANLQHPHILPLFDSGEVDGTVFYVMPSVEGESLRDRLQREKQLPVSDALRITTQVAQALDYAHRHGVIHRDIKPENILLHDQSALVADFGIALAASRAGDTRMTETGMSLGTPHYMSPEQAMGERSLDVRTDVYALGATLYEMLTGEPPFTGATAQAIVARVLSEAPRPITTIRPAVPPHVDRAVRTALQKLPADRHASAAAFSEALTRPGDEQAAMAAGAARAPGWRQRVPWLVAAIAVVVVAAALWPGRIQQAPGPRPSRLAILAPGLGGSGGTGLMRHLALTPDGETVVYVAVGDDGVNRLMRQALDTEQPAAVPASNVSYSLGNPLVSPDGRSIYSTNVEGRLFRFPMEGGAARPIGPDLQFGSFASFGAGGTLWISRGSGAAVVSIGPADSVVEHGGALAAEARIQQVLSDGRRALVVRRAVGDAIGPLVVVDLPTGEVLTTLEGQVVEARYTAGYLLSVLNNGNLLATPFDERRGEVTGTPVTIATGLALTGTGVAQFAVAPEGTVAYIPEEPRTLVFVDRTGGMRLALPDPRNYHAPVFSPDGRRLAMDFNTADGRDVWVLELDGGTLTRATFDRDGHDPVWAPDGRHLLYLSSKSGVLGLYRARVGSTEPPDSVLASPTLGWTGQWLADGSGIVTVGNSLRPGSGSDIGIVRDVGRGALEPLVATQYTESYPAVSPDQRWLAYTSDQSGQQEVYLRPLSGEGELVQVSQGGGSEPVWSRDGRELFYRRTGGGGTVLVGAQIRTTPTLGVAARQELFSLVDLVGTQPHANYDVSPDGRTFVMVRRSPSTRIMVIQNLPALVERIRARGGGAP